MQRELESIVEEPQSPRCGRAKAPAVLELPSEPKATRVPRSPPTLDGCAVCEPAVRGGPPLRFGVRGQGPSQSNPSPNRMPDASQEAPGLPGGGSAF